MDKVIKITSVQGFSDSWLNTARPTNLNLLDFVIPEGIICDLSRSYISVQVQVDNSIYIDAAAQTLYLEVNGDDKMNVPNAALIRNISFTNNKGQAENMRNADTLACALWGASNTTATQQSDLNTLAEWNDAAGVKNLSTFLLDVVNTNVSNDGATADLTHRSRDIRRAIKIPLKDVLGIGNTTAYDTSSNKFGQTHIKCETNFAKLKSAYTGGFEDVSDSFDETNVWGKITYDEAALPGTGTPAERSTPLEMEFTVDYTNIDWELCCPFFVGQLVNATYDVDGVNRDTLLDRTITKLQFQKDNTKLSAANGGLGKMFVTFDEAVHTNNAGIGPQAVNNIKLKAANAGIQTNVVNMAELCLYTLPPGTDTPDSISYPVYTTEQDNGNGLLKFSRQYQIEPQADAVLICGTNDGEILPNRTFRSYRYDINNVPQTGNRDILMGHGNTIVGSPLYYDRLQRCLESQIGIGWRNNQMRFCKWTNTQGLNYIEPNCLIAETCDEGVEPKMMGIEIEAEDGGTVANLLLYKHMMRTI